MMGGMGQIEEGRLKGRRFIIPNTVMVEKGTTPEGFIQFTSACLKHERFIPSNGCPLCEEEAKEREQQNKELGLG